MRSAVAALVLIVVAGCDPTPETPPGWQGVVEYDERVLAFEVSGRVATIEVDEGDEVGAGAVLARLDPTLETLARAVRVAEAKAVAAELDLLEAGSRPEDIDKVEAALRAAKANLEHAERTLAREEKLVAEGIGAVATLDDARTSFSNASAQRRELQATLRRLRNGARAPEIAGAAARLEAAQAAVQLGDARIARHDMRTEHPGLVLAVHVESDEVVSATAPVVTLGDTTHPYVDVFVPEGDVGGLELGGRVSVDVDSHDHGYPGTIEYIGRRTEFTPRFLFSERERPNLVLRVRVRIDAPDGDLHAGVPAFVTAETAG